MIATKPIDLRERLKEYLDSAFDGEPKMKKEAGVTWAIHIRTCKIPIRVLEGITKDIRVNNPIADWKFFCLRLGC